MSEEQPKRGTGDSDLAKDLEPAADEANAAKQPDWLELTRLMATTERLAHDGALTREDLAASINRVNFLVPVDRAELRREYADELRNIGAEVGIK